MKDSRRQRVSRPRYEEKRSTFQSQNLIETQKVFPSCLCKTILPHPEIIKLTLTPAVVEGGKIGGLVKKTLKNWEKITTDKTILNMVKGCTIQFIGTPPTNLKTHQSRFSNQERQLITTEVEEMKRKGAIAEVSPTSGQFLGHIFLRPKRDGSQRPIFNLKQLNNLAHYQHFKMEGLCLVKSLLQQGDWMLKLDLKDAYFCVPMEERCKKFLRFKWEAKLYEFQCLPFGLASAPRDFTKLLKPAVGILRRIGIRVIIYLDDLLLMNQCPNTLLRDGKTASHLLESLGFVINITKSHTTPSRPRIPGNYTTQYR